MTDEPVPRWRTPSDDEIKEAIFALNPLIQQSEDYIFRPAIKARTMLVMLLDSCRPPDPLLEEMAEALMRLLMRKNSPFARDFARDVLSKYMLSRKEEK